MKSRGLAISIVIASVAAGCAGNKTRVADNRNQAETLNEVGRQLSLAQSEDIDLLAPKHFQKAEDEYNEARELQTKSNEASVPDILKKSDEAVASLAAGRETAQVARIKIGDALKARHRAENARVLADQARGGLPDTLLNDYRDAARDFYQTTRKMEDGDISSADKMEKELADRYAGLERRSANYQYANPSAEILQSMKVEGAEKWAPQAYQTAMERNKAVVDAINENPGDRAGIAKLSMAADESAATLVDRTRESKHLASLSPEARAKYLSERAERERAMEAERQQAQNQPAPTQNRQISSTEQEQLKAEQRYLQAVQTLPSDQADVLRRGDQLIVRLKGMSFAVGKAAIPAQSKDLLDKVPQVIVSYGPNMHVTVAGRTDATGGVAINKKLSQKRAEAVRDYFVKQGKIPEQNVEAKGISDLRPVTSNRTPAGRKLNRGVDVVVVEVSPAQQP